MAPRGLRIRTHSRSHANTPVPNPRQPADRKAVKTTAFKDLPMIQRYTVLEMLFGQDCARRILPQVCGHPDNDPEWR